MGKKHTMEHFKKRIKQLQGELRKALPPLDESTRAEFVTACTCARSCRQARDDAQANLDSLKKAKSDQELIDEAEEILKSMEQNVDEAEDIMIASGKRILDTLGDLRDHVSEASLLECAILCQATPENLSDWVNENPAKHNKYLDSFFGDPLWMKQMIMGGGATNGNYGEAIAIHATLLLNLYHRNESLSEVRHKLALAVALEHATAIEVFKDPDTLIDPASRFWHYVNAFENGELDESFEKFSVWELRMVVDSNAKDEELAWGRNYLKAYRPDEITDYDYHWKYAWSVRSDCNYKNPDHEYNNYKELISAGGKCGPRAFFGRFVCKAWGCPTWGVKQPGHAAMSRWTPNGWVICLGAAFKWSKWDDERPNATRMRNGPDFVEETKARASCCISTYYHKVDLLNCLSDTYLEPILEHVDPKYLWRSLALVERRLLAATSTEKEASPAQQTAPTCPLSVRETREEAYHLDYNGTIIIPAAAFDKPLKPDKNQLIVSPSYVLHGYQIHLENDGFVSYRLPEIVPTGSYQLRARVVTIHRHQVPLHVELLCEDGALLTAPSQLEIPYTVGRWQWTALVTVDIIPGAFLRISRTEDCHGLTIKDLTLTPCLEFG